MKHEFKVYRATIEIVFGVHCDISKPEQKDFDNCARWIKIEAAEAIENAQIDVPFIHASSVNYDSPVELVPAPNAKKEEIGS